MLQRKVFFHLCRAATIGDEQVALALKADLGRLRIERHDAGKIRVEGQPVRCHLDVLRQAEEAANAAVGTRRRSLLVSRITLNDDDVARTAGAREVIGDA